MIRKDGYYKIRWENGEGIAHVTEVMDDAVLFYVGGDAQATTPGKFKEAIICEMGVVPMAPHPEIIPVEELRQQVLAEVQQYANHLLMDSSVGMDNLTAQLVDYFFIQGWRITEYDLVYTREWRRREAWHNLASLPGLVTNHRLMHLQRIAAERVGAKWVAGVDEVNGELVLYLHAGAPETTFPLELNAVPVRVTREPYPLDSQSELRRYARVPDHRSITR